MKRDDVERLEKMLREEGRQDTPAFSIALHERALTALREKGLPQQTTQAARPAGTSWLWKIGIPLAAAACVAAIAWVALQPSTPSNKPDKPIANVPAPSPRRTAPLESPTLPNLAAVVETPDSQLNQARFAYLDRDAMRFWTFLADQVPQLPAPQSGPRQ